MGIDFKFDKSYKETAETLKLIKQMKKDSKVTGDWLDAILDYEKLLKAVSKFKAKHKKVNKWV